MQLLFALEFLEVPYIVAFRCADAVANDLR